MASVAEEKRMSCVSLLKVLRQVLILVAASSADAFHPFRAFALVCTL